MKKEEIHLADWQRIVFGEVPGGFYVELIIRAAIIYLLLMFAMRMMGKRMSGLLTRNELVAMVSLAAAIGTPLTSADRGILPAVIIAFLVVYIERWISAFAFRNEKFERYAIGKLDILVNDAVIDLEVLKKVRISRERLMAELRGSGVRQLGSVKRFYMEANGAFTLIKNEEPNEGLLILPSWDREFCERLTRSVTQYACVSCGLLQPKTIDPTTSCPHCRHTEWQAAFK
ncbi:YetF domain-containing protein [Mucilaginibacter pineti]|nr:YetF domain-containing protein [Mucilaginibacter pineti]